MKQASLWNDDEDRVPDAMWTRMPEHVRAEIVAQLVCVVVVSLIGKDKNMQRSDEEKKR
jgi:hypothetical protein